MVTPAKTLLRWRSETLLSYVWSAHGTARGGARAFVRGRFWRFCQWPCFHVRPPACRAVGPRRHRPALALTIARIPALTGSGSVGHAVTTACRSASRRTASHTVSPARVVQSVRQSRFSPPSALSVSISLGVSCVSFPPDSARGSNPLGGVFRRVSARFAAVRRGFGRN